MTETKDMLGNTLKAGSIITYPGRQGSSMWMNLAVVLDVEVEEIIDHWQPARITYPILKVLYIGTNWDGNVTTRKTYIKCLDRVVALRGALLHPEQSEIHKRILVEQGKAILKGENK